MEYPKHKYPVGMMCIVTHDNNRQNSSPSWHGGVPAGTLCQIVKHDQVTLRINKINYIVKFFPESVYQELNECGPFMYEDSLTPNTVAGKILFDTCIDSIQPSQLKIK